MDMSKDKNREMEERRTIALSKANIFFVARELQRSDVTESEKFGLMLSLGSGLHQELEEYRNPA